MQHHNYMAQLVAMLLCILCLSACTSNTGNKGTKKRFFRYNQASGISSLDPAFAKDQANIWAVNQLFNGLVQMDDDLNIKPCIAKSWDISADGLTYTFHLRDDVYFHNHEAFPDGKGTRVTANDVAYSLNRVINPKVASSGAWLFNEKVAKNAPFQALNDSTFQMTLQQPFPPMLGILSMQYCSIVPKVVAEKYGKDFRRNPVGTGAFTFKTWKENEVLVLLANPNYWEKTERGQQLPLIDGVRVSFIENKRNAFLKFLDGDLDMISGIDPTYKDDVLTKTGTLKPELADKIQLLRSPYMNTEYLGFNLDPTLQSNKDLLNVKVRQAINYGFDRQKMMQFLRNNIGMPAISGFVPKGFPSFDSKKVPGYTYNPQKARTLLAEAGFPNGKGLSPITLETTNSYQDLCIFIQNQLQEIGIKVNIELHPPAFLREKTAKGEADFFRASWIGDYPDAETYLTVLYGGNPAPPNYTRFNNPAYNEAYKKALKSTNVQHAQALYQEMDRIIIEQAPIVPLYYDEVLRFSQKNVQQLGVNTFNLLSLKNVQLTP